MIGRVSSSDRFDPSLGAISLSAEGYRANELDPKFDGSFSVSYELVPSGGGF
jgi:hypothetical protein